MVHRFMDNSADESQIGTLTGLLVRYFSAQCGQRHALHLLHIGWGLAHNVGWHQCNRDCASSGVVQSCRAL